MYKVFLLSSCMKCFQQKNVIFCNFLLTSALFRKHFPHKVRGMTSISFEEVTCSFTGKKVMVFLAILVLSGKNSGL